MFKPLLAPREDPLSYKAFWDRIIFPILGSPKLDGIRGYTEGGVLKSRTGKLLPSSQAQELFGKYPFLDGEVHVGDPSNPSVYNLTQSHIMSYEKPAEDLRYSVFDYIHPSALNCCYEERLDILNDYVESLNNPKIFVLPQKLLNSREELEVFEQECLEDGYEGIMLRSQSGRYKCGRATILENIIIKLKRFMDDEGVLLDILPRMHNTNAQERDEFGNSKRSSAKDGLVETDIAGKFVLAYKGMELEVAPGSFNHFELKTLLQNKERYVGSLLKFRYFPYGIKDKPRFPRAVGFRDKIDI